MMPNKETFIRALKYWSRPVLIMLASFLVISFFADRITDISSRIKEARVATAILQKRIETIGNLETELNLVGAENIEKLNRIIPTTDDIANLSVQLANIGKANNINLLQTIGSTLTPANFDLKDPDYRLSTIDYSASATASVSSLIRFLKALEASNYLLAIESMTLSSPQDQGWFANSTVSIKGKLYLKQPLR